MFNFKQNIQHISGVLLLTLFTGYFVGTSFFPHKHIVDGKIVVHSHPFSSTEPHSHSCNALNLLQKISHFESKTLTTSLLIVACLKFIQIIGNRPKQQIVTSIYNYQLFTRPPPFLA